MADKNNKVASNVSGKYYVDTTCIACGACLIEAESFLRMNEDEGYAYFFTQPTSEEDEKFCQEAKFTCPVESIGDDG